MRHCMQRTCHSMVGVFAVVVSMAASSSTPSPRPNCVDPKELAPSPLCAGEMDQSPRVSIGSYGVSIIKPERYASKDPLTMGELRAAFLDMPSSDWPCGCVVNTYGQSFGDDETFKQAGRHGEEFAKLIKELGIQFGWGVS